MVKERDAPNKLDGIGRDQKGRFEKGHAPTGAGRKPQPPEFRELAVSNAPKALQVVIDVMNNPKASNKDRLPAFGMMDDANRELVKDNCDCSPLFQVEYRI